MEPKATFIFRPETLWILVFHRRVKTTGLESRFPLLSETVKLKNGPELKTNQEVMLCLGTVEKYNVKDFVLLTCMNPKNINLFFFLFTHLYSRLNMCQFN